MRPATNRTYNILSVEDNPGDTFLIKRAIEHCGYDCVLTCCTSREEAVRILCSKSFDLLFADFGTDSADASRFLQSVRGRHPQMPITVLSGTLDSAKAYECGAHVFVHKDCDWRAFAGKIRKLMAFWIEVAEVPELSRTRPRDDAAA